jgi:hypothetical protein
MNETKFLRNLFAVLAILGVASAATAQEASYTILDLGALGDATHI